MNTQRARDAYVQNANKELIDDINCVNGQYLCKKKLGSGGFGEVWSCTDIHSESRVQRDGTVEQDEYAIKIENLQEPTEKQKKQGITKKQPVPQNQSQLVYEHKIYKIL